MTGEGLNCLYSKTHNFIPSHNDNMLYMKKGVLFFILFQCVSIAAFAQLRVVNLLCENKTNPVSVEAKQPRLTWQLQSNGRNVLQTAYEIRVSEGGAPNDKNALWSSGKVASDQSVLVPYAGSDLQSGKKYYWQVRVWDNAKNSSGWSTPASWQMGLLNAGDWKAKWISPGYTEDEKMRPSPYFRKTFNTGKKLASAIAYITSHGLYEAFINGKRVGNYYLTPGWTSYNKRLQYQQYDVLPLLQTGANAVGVALGSGWYRGSLAWQDNNNIYGKELGLLFQLNLTYTDGTQETIISDESWKSATGAVRYSEIYNGEVFDAREE
jgi:alpha-L-rhamnosidase